MACHLLATDGVNAQIAQGPEQRAYNDGRAAHGASLPLAANPRRNALQRRAWVNGWYDNQAAQQQAWAWWRNASTDANTLAVAHEVATKVGLQQLLDRPAGLLSHGQKRQLEIAMCLATAPQVLLLDEPLAGMGAEETERMLALLDALRGRHAILLVEHDMDAVFRIADRITVMVNGAVIASDTPDAVRASPAVQTAYLGGH